MKCDAKAFAQMYETIYKELYRFALCMMRNPHDAEDAVSEAVIAAYEHIGRLRKEEAFKSWMFTILANKCKKKLLKEKNSERVLIQEESIEPVDVGLSIDVKKAFAVLSEEEQVIVALSVFGGYKSREIGEIMNLNFNTVRSKRSRALEKMSYVLE